MALEIIITHEQMEAMDALLRNRTDLPAYGNVALRLGIKIAPSTLRHKHRAWLFHGRKFHKIAPVYERPRNKENYVHADGWEVDYGC